MPATVRATCPGCQTVLRIPADWADRAVKCKKCGAVVRGKPTAKPAPPSEAGRRHSGRRSAADAGLTRRQARSAGRRARARPPRLPAAVRPAAGRLPTPSAQPESINPALDFDLPPLPARYRRRSGIGKYVGVVFALLLLGALVAGGVLRGPVREAVPRSVPGERRAAGPEHRPRSSRRPPRWRRPTGPFPRRMLVMHASKYLYCNALAAGNHEESAGPRHRGNATAGVRLAGVARGRQQPALRPERHRREGRPADAAADRHGDLRAVLRDEPAAGPGGPLLRRTRGRQGGQGVPRPDRRRPRRPEHPDPARRLLGEGEGLPGPAKGGRLRRLPTERGRRHAPPRQRADDAGVGESSARRPAGGAGRHHLLGRAERPGVPPAAARRCPTWPGVCSSAHSSHVGDKGTANGDKAASPEDPLPIARWVEAAQVPDEGGRRDHRNASPDAEGGRLRIGRRGRAEPGRAAGRAVRVPRPAEGDRAGRGGPDRGPDRAAAACGPARSSTEKEVPLDRARPVRRGDDEGIHARRGQRRGRPGRPGEVPDPQGGARHPGRTEDVVGRGSASRGSSTSSPARRTTR